MRLVSWALLAAAIYVMFPGIAPWRGVAGFVCLAAFTGCREVLAMEDNE